MCGILGHVSKMKLLDECSYYAGLERIAHRGPDATGLYLDKENKVALGHVRLSILDVSDSADQPMLHEESVVVVFNGEIYNFRELREQYLSGVPMVTSSDTEVLTKLYVKLGIDQLLEIIRGMFAFAIYDKPLGKVYLARDQVGKKPLYYFSNSSELFFGSEIRAFGPELPEKISIRDSVFNDCLYFKFSDDLSPYENIKMLDSGSYLEYSIESSKCDVKTYFRMSDLISEKEYVKNSKLSTSELVTKLDSLLYASIERRLISDVPIASINSGGIDSSLISAIAYKVNGLKMYHVDVDGHSEIYYAQLLAQYLGEDLVVKNISVTDVEENLDEVIEYLEYPLVHSNSFGISEVSKLARENGIKVLLGGEGADELFGGYRFQRRYNFAKQFSNKLTKYVANIFGKLTAFIEDDASFKAYEKGIFSEEKTRIFDRKSKNLDAYHFVKNKRDREVCAFMLGICQEYLQPILLRADKMGMKNSVEIRSPFLDLGVVEFALNLPPNRKFQLMNGKHIVKKVAERYLPKEIIYRKKVGFPMPFSEKFRMSRNEGPDRNYILYSKKILQAHVSYKSN